MVITTPHEQMLVLDQPKTAKQKLIDEALVDLFCGCGGSGGGLLDATDLLGRKVQGTFVNHWDKAIEAHNENHPEHRHLEEDLFTLDPTALFPVGTHCSLLWASPQCTFFSVARGASCVNEQDRSHAHSVTDWVKHLRPECVLVENVAEFLQWGAVMQKRFDGELMWALNAKPVYPKRDPKHPSRKVLSKAHKRQDGESEAAWSKRMLAEGYKPYEVPDPERKGEYFEAWIDEMKELGYKADWKILKSADYGDPTIRRRLFVYLVREDTGKEIVWPEAYAGEKGKDHGRPMNWRTAREIIDWSQKGENIFARKRPLADNTLRRLAIGMVKYGMRPYLVSSAHGSPKPTDCDRRVHSADEPLKTLTAKGDRGVVQPEAFMLPKDAGHQQDNVRSIDSPVQAITTKAHEVLATPSCQMIDNQRGTGVCKGVDEPLRTNTAGGNHQALAEAFTDAFMFSIDQTGGSRGNHGTYSVDEPVKTLVTKANQTCVSVEVEAVSEKFLKSCEDRGVDTHSANKFLGFLMEELKRKGQVDVEPYIYVYYSNGSEGKHIDEPLPAVRTKAGHALAEPVIKLDGKFIKISLFYRMLSPTELQRAMGFPDDMKWGSLNKTEQIRAIGNSVSRGVSRALGLAWYSQNADVWQHVKQLYEQP